MQDEQRSSSSGTSWSRNVTALLFLALGLGSFASAPQTARASQSTTQQSASLKERVVDDSTGVSEDSTTSSEEDVAAPRIAFHTTNDEGIMKAEYTYDQDQQVGIRIREANEGLGISARTNLATLSTKNTWNGSHLYTHVTNEPGSDSASVGLRLDLPVNEGHVAVGGHRGGFAPNTLFAGLLTGPFEPEGWSVSVLYRMQENSKEGFDVNGVYREVFEDAFYGDDLYAGVGRKGDESFISAAVGDTTTTQGATAKLAYDERSKTLSLKWKYANERREGPKGVGITRRSFFDSQFGYSASGMPGDAPAAFPPIKQVFNYPAEITKDGGLEGVVEWRRKESRVDTELTLGQWYPNKESGVYAGIGARTEGMKLGEVSAYAAFDANRVGLNGIAGLEVSVTDDGQYDFRFTGSLDL